MEDLPTDLDMVTKELRAWLAQWKPAIERWASINRPENEAFVKLIEPVPELLRLCSNLIKDPSVPFDQKKHLYTTMSYVFDADDRLSEGELGVPGLVDDSLKMTNLLQQLVGRYTHLLTNNWSGEGNVIEVLDYVQEHAKQYDSKGKLKSTPGGGPDVPNPSPTV
jgi:hypothetical protein